MGMYCPHVNINTINLSALKALSEFRVCSDITNDQLGISGETGHGGANLRVY